MASALRDVEVNARGGVLAPRGEVAGHSASTARELLAVRLHEHADLLDLEAHLQKWARKTARATFVLGIQTFYDSVQTVYQVRNRSFAFVTLSRIARERSIEINGDA